MYAYVYLQLYVHTHSLSQLGVQCKVLLTSTYAVQRVVACCSVWQLVAAGHTAFGIDHLHIRRTVCCSVLQCVAVCGNSRLS